MSKRNIALIIGGAIGLIVAILFVIPHAAGATRPAPTGPVHLDGQWHQTHSGMPNIQMTAKISENTITIDMLTGDTHGVYWIGTFSVLDNTASSFTVTSRGDTDAMSTQIYASQDATKTFTYKDGQLSYPFSMLGVSTTVYLSQGA